MKSSDFAKTEWPFRKPGQVFSGGRSVEALFPSLRVTIDKEIVAQLVLMGAVVSVSSSGESPYTWAKFGSGLHHRPDCA